MKSNGLSSCTIDNLNNAQGQVNKFSSIFLNVFYDAECKKSWNNEYN